MTRFRTSPSSHWENSARYDRTCPHTAHTANNVTTSARHHQLQRQLKITDEQELKNCAAYAQERDEMRWVTPDKIHSVSVPCARAAVRQIQAQQTPCVSARVKKQASLGRKLSQQGIQLWRPFQPWLASLKDSSMDKSAYAPIHGGAQPVAREG